MGGGCGVGEREREREREKEGKKQRERVCCCERNSLRGGGVREKKAAPFQRKKTETNEKYETLFQKEKRKELFQKKGEG